MCSSTPITASPDTQLCLLSLIHIYVPIKDTIQSLEHLLRQNNMPETHIHEIITLTKIITEQNYFTYNNKIYTQTDGLLMGSPISGILAEIYTQHRTEPHNKQQQIHQQNHLLAQVCRWHITFIQRQHKTSWKLPQIHNTIHHKLKFTLEIEQNNSIHFLDLTINKTNNTHTYKMCHSAFVLLY